MSVSGTYESQENINARQEHLQPSHAMSNILFSCLTALENVVKVFVWSFYFFAIQYFCSCTFLPLKSSSSSLQTRDIIFVWLWYMFLLFQLLPNTLNPLITHFFHFLVEFLQSVSRYSLPVLLLMIPGSWRIGQICPSEDTSEALIIRLDSWLRVLSTPCRVCHFWIMLVTILPLP